MPSPNCSNTSINVRPLTDLGPRYYQGRQGGLYPDGLNVRPAAHEAAGVAIAATIEPLDASGTPSSSGKIPFVAVGFSFTKRIFNQFLPLVAADTAIGSAVVAVNGAKAGEDATDLENPSDNYWTTKLPAELAAAGITKEQVQVIWLLEGSRAQLNGWPDDVDFLTEQLVSVVQNCKAFFPNLKLCYCATPHYEGYAGAATPFEPNAFEQGFAMKALIEQQINGEPELDYTDGTAPWLSWAGYCWTDGATTRSDGLNWSCPTDCDTDGAHQSSAGALKQATRLLAEFKGDPTCAPWLLASGVATCDVPASATIYGDGVVGTGGALPLIAISKPTVPGDLAPKLILERGKPGATALFMLGPNPQATPFAGGNLYVGFTDWVTQEIAVDANGRAEWEMPDVPTDACGVVSYAQVAIEDTGAVNGYALTEGLRLVVGA